MRTSLLMMLSGGVALALGACGGGGTSTASATSSPTTSSTTPSIAPTPAMPGPCVKAETEVAAAPGSSSAGHEKTNYTVTNNSSQTCTLFGCPVLEWVNSDGSPIPTATIAEGGAMTLPSPPALALVTLVPGGSAYFDEEVASDFNNCQTASVRLHLPSDQGYFVEATPRMLCKTMTLTVTAFASSRQP